MCLGLNSQIKFFSVLCTYSFHDSSFIKRQSLSGGGHKFSEFACF